jgi:hypothetical protein
MRTWTADDIKPLSQTALRAIDHEPAKLIAASS